MVHRGELLTDTWLVARYFLFCETALSLEWRPGVISLVWRRRLTIFVGGVLLHDQQARLQGFWRYAQFYHFSTVTASHLRGREPAWHRKLRRRGTKARVVLCGFLPGARIARRRAQKAVELLQNHHSVPSIA